LVDQTRSQATATAEVTGKKSTFCGGDNGIRGPRRATAISPIDLDAERLNTAPGSNGDQPKMLQLNDATNALVGDPAAPLPFTTPALANEDMNKLIESNGSVNDDMDQSEHSGEAENTQMTEEDVQKKKANDELARLEKMYWETQNELDDHYESYNNKYAEFVDANPDKTAKSCKELFGPIYLQKGMAISKQLSDAEADTKVGRLAAREAGVNQPNSCDQESAFLTAAGEGEGSTKANRQRAIDECDHEWIDDWANDSEKTSKLQLVEAQYALSGAEVDPWESRSSCGEKRKKIDEYGISKRRKVNAEGGYQVPEGDDAANKEQGTSESSGRNPEVTMANPMHRARMIVGDDSLDLQFFDDRRDLQACLRGLRVPTAIPTMVSTLFVPTCYGTLTDLGERWANPQRTTPDWQPTDSA
jgi:hypothetical protein